MDPCYVTYEIPLREPWCERVIVSREPPRSRSGEPIERGPCGLVDGVWIVAHGRFENFWAADAYVSRHWPTLHRPMSATTFWSPVVEYRHWGC
jgi:hypothetical protein